ncbi:hypothetical protein BDK88_3619 [Natrinema hispanicum]|uniref:Uncharacterized protein n=1 Tax=Natrinema hispanicum TaxID=392421 RepID=A0A482Y6G8_9EURY|nr:hypothetical protein [Natrinema hispanicum]RZV06601.1 hypothetical protein BDK88_3619 [Natrinema hispanicum]
MGISEWIPTSEEFKPNWLSPVTFRQSVVRISYVIGLGIVLSILVEITLQLLGISVVFQSRITITTLLSTVGPIILSTLLAYLYYQQKQILSKEHRSNISVNRFIGADEDNIRLKISNAGSGVIRSVLLRIDLEFDDGDIRGKSNYLDLKTENGDSSRTFVKPYEADTIFSKKLLLPIKFPDESDHRIPPFGMAMRFAEQYGATSGHLKIDLVWEDAIQTGQITVFDEDFEVKGIEDFENFIEEYPEQSAVLFGGLD